MPVWDKEGIQLYPIDSEFGFYVVDFLGARQKIRDYDYMEGFAGNIEYQDQVVGIKVSNSVTDRYKVKPPLGTWCQGLGGTSIKCSTEHYVAMEHVLSCHEVIPYMLADPVSGAQKELSFPWPYDEDPTTNCANADLDDALNIISGGTVLWDEFLTSVAPGTDMDANDNTTVKDNIALSSDYSVTLKDDGKPLYRWGAMIKRPNDIRLYAKLQLPQAWKIKDDLGNYPRFEVSKAHLIVNHWITNNPNDQLRPEDLENEAATGRKPDYEVDGDGNWLSTRDCYEGDGDFLDTLEDGLDPDYLPAGTFLKNAKFADAPYGASPPQVFSKDLLMGYTNAYYTTINRDPFEWSYRLKGLGDDVYKFVGFPFPLTADEEFLANVEFVSGPRWRLKSNKFGQDICGLEIPSAECSAPPFQHDNIKYEVGEMVTTVINLLDWEDATESPLAFSDGWVDVTKNWKVLEGAGVVNGISGNGLPMTEDFDLAVYIKGDRKATAIFNAKLEIDYVGETPEIPDEWDVAVIDVDYPDEILTTDPVTVTATVTNYGPAPTLVTVSLSCEDNRDNAWVATLDSLEMLGNDQDALVMFSILNNETAERPTTLDCTLLADAEGDVNPINNSVDLKIKVKKPKD